MDQTQPPANLTEVLQRLRDHTRGQDEITVGDLLSAVGQRSFGPVVLIAGLIIIAPLIGDIPGVPTLFGLVVLLTLGQLLFQRQSIWIPRKLSSRHLARETLIKGLDWLHKPARYVDRWTRPRLTWLVRGPGQYLMALICMLVAAAMPAMEVVPFSANGGALALMVFGMAMVVEDGLLALFGMVITGSTLWAVFVGLMS